jgi:hypothetical protein
MMLLLGDIKTTMQQKKEREKEEQHTKELQLFFSSEKEKMSLALHAHQIFLIATLAFAAAILIPFWYRPPNLQIRRNIFQVCDTKGCYWTLLPSTASNQTVVTSKKEKD